MNHLLRCPTCGPLGRKLKRRNRQAADTALILFHSHLAAQTRAEAVAR